MNYDPAEPVETRINRLASRSLRNSFAGEQGTQSQLTMEITVVDQEENPMLHRTDVQFRVSHVEATPDRLAVRDSLAAQLNKDAGEVVVRKLDTKFGMRTTYGEAKVYESPNDAKEIEQNYMLERNKIANGNGDEDDDEQ